MEIETPLSWAINYPTECSEEMEKLYRLTHEKVDRIICRTNEQKEWLIEAFLAETGLKPSECEIVEKRSANETTWFIRKRKD